MSDKKLPQPPPQAVPAPLAPTDPQHQTRLPAWAPEILSFLKELAAADLRPSTTMIDMVVAAMITEGDLHAGVLDFMRKLVLHSRVDALHSFWLTASSLRRGPVRTDLDQQREAGD